MSLNTLKIIQETEVIKILLFPHFKYYNVLQELETTVLRPKYCQCQSRNEEGQIINLTRTAATI